MIIGETRQRRRSRLDEIANLLRTIDADIVALNEVDFDSTWSHGINQAEYLAQKAGYTYWAEERNLDFRVATYSWCFGNAILSKHPIANAKVVNLPSYESWETWFAGKKRGLLATIDIGNQKINVISAHLSHRSEELRVASAEHLIQLSDSLDDHVIIAGDFNSTPPAYPGSSETPAGNNAVAIFDQSTQFSRRPNRMPTRSDFTYPADRPSRTIDWILIPTSCSFLEYRTVDSTLSDHLPLSAVVRLPNTP